MSLYQNKVEQIKEQVDHTILGAYMTGVAKDAVYLGKNTTMRGLGEAFCKLYDEEQVDLRKDRLVNIDDYFSAPKAGGVVSNLISQVNTKIDAMASNIGTFNSPISESVDMLVGYANKLQKAAIRIAYSEGVEDDELKEDLKVLLKDAKDEFIKREEEEAEETGNEELVDNGMDSLEDTGFEDESMDDEGLDNFGDIGDEDSTEGELVDDDGNPISGDDTEEENTEGSADSEDDAIDDIPTGESHIQSKEIRKAVAEAFKIDNTLTDDEFAEALTTGNLSKAYAEDRKYMYKGDIVTTNPFHIKKMKKSLLEIEKASMKALGESAGISNVMENDELQLAHKAVVNELALVMMTRNKLGYKIK